MRRRPTTQDISWFLDLKRNDQLDLNPPYQRRSVWTNKDRRYFLDTIFRGYPCPAIFLHKRMTEQGRSIYDVVDGKQRLETILMFTDDAISIDPSHTDSRLAGKKWKTLGDAERREFWNYVLPVEQLDFEEGETSAVEDSFDRLNRNSRKLEPQELRHARFDGWFISFVEEETANKFWSDIGVVTRARFKRMKDAQFVAELFLVLIEKKISGFDQNYLDYAHAKYDDPDDEGIVLDTEQVKEDLESVKDFLGQAEQRNGCVRLAAATVGTFYSLWSLIVLHRAAIGEPIQFAEKYSKFIDLSKRLLASAKSGQVELELDAQEIILKDSALAYGQASAGAHTDLGPRTTRLNCLLKALALE
ncbi:MAG: DUF262 domain-containing protein [Akkermansiaceae bacterium]|nr:DUF262 domain-containing protein [Akkermansiaceae bacterium]